MLLKGEGLCPDRKWYSLPQLGSVPQTPPLSSPSSLYSTQSSTRGPDQCCGVLLRRYKLVSGVQPRAQDPSHSWIRPWPYKVPLTLSAFPPCARQLIQYYLPRTQAQTNKVLPLLPAPPLLQAPPYFNQEPRPSSNPAPSPVLHADPALLILGTPPPILHPRPVPGGPAPPGLRGRGRAATFGGIRRGGRFPAPSAELAPALPLRSQLRRARSRAPRSGVAEARGR